MLITKRLAKNNPMKRLIIPVLLVALIISSTSCHNKKGGVGKIVQKQSELLELYNTADSVYYVGKRIDTALFGRFIRKAVDFANNYPNDEIAPEMLYRAGIGSMILAKNATERVTKAEYAKQAIDIFLTYQKKFPDGEQAEYCYYQRGIIYDDILGDTRSAENEYRDFINRNPNDSLTPQLKQYIKLLGMSESQLEEALDLK